MLSDSISYTLKRNISGFTQDSVWVVETHIPNMQHLSNIEIWLKGDKMQLIEPSDDGSSYEFECLE